MQRLLKYIDNKVLFKGGRLNNTSIIVKVLGGIFTSKAIAIYIGVEGMALIGNLSNFFNAIRSLALLGFYNGLVKYIAEFKDNVLKLSKTLSTAYYLGFFATIFLSLLSYYNAETLNDFLFSENYNYTFVIKILAFALPFYSLNMFSFSIMNGFSKYKILLIINIIGQILGLFITLLLIYQNKIEGALVAVVIAPSLMFLVTLVGVINRKSLIPQIKLSNVDFNILKKFTPFMVIALITTIGMPIVYILVRNYIIENVGMKYAGFWEAMNRISDYYLMFVTSMMTLYVIPKFRELKNKKEFKTEIISTYKSLVPVFGLGLFVIYLFRPLIVKIVFSSEFQPMEDLFIWQLLGDFVKTLSIVIAYQFLAKKMFWHYIITEVFSVIILYICSIYFIDLYGVKGANIAHFVTYLLYYGVILLIFYSSFFDVDKEANLNE